MRDHMNVRAYTKDQFQIIRGRGYGGFGIVEEANLVKFGRVRICKNFQAMCSIKL